MTQIVKISPDLHKRLEDNEDRLIYKTGPRSTIILARTCPQCGGPFWPTRKDKKFCSPSCRVMACYKRKKYVYKGGSFKKGEAKLKNDHLVIKNENIPRPPDLSPKRSITTAGIAESLIGASAVQLAKYGLVERPLEKKIDRILSLLEVLAKKFLKL